MRRFLNFSYVRLRVRRCCPIIGANDAGDRSSAASRPFSEQAVGAIAKRVGRPPRARTRLRRGASGGGVERKTRRPSSSRRAARSGAIQPGAMRIAQEEIFGPVTTVIPVGSIEEAVAVNNGVRYGLSSSIYTADVNRAFRAIEALDTGIVYVNHGTTGAEIQLPFGGTKATGNGHREADQAALDTYTEWKSVYVDYSGRLQRAQIDRE